MDNMCLVFPNADQDLSVHQEWSLSVGPKYDQALGMIRLDAEPYDRTPHCGRVPFRNTDNNSKVHRQALATIKDELDDTEQCTGIGLTRSKAIPITVGVSRPSHRHCS